MVPLKGGGVSWVALLPFSRKMEVMILLDRIVSDPALMNGQPCLRGLRLSVRRVVEIAASYPDSAERALEYPELEDEDIRQALHFAARFLPDEIVPLVDQGMGSGLRRKSVEP
jgi:uncharacterized protein (DUF433 family)